MYAFPSKAPGLIRAVALRGLRLQALCQLGLLRPHGRAHRPRPAVPQMLERPRHRGLARHVGKSVREISGNLKDSFSFLLKLLVPGLNIADFRVSNLDLVMQR